MILSNDQKHTFTTFSARAFVRKEETTTEGEEEEITSFFHARELLFFLFCTPAVTNFCCGAFSKKRFFVRVVLSFCDFCLSGLCNSSAFSSAFVPFAPSNFLISSEQQRTHILLYYYIAEKGEKERERERKRKARNS